MTDRHLSAILPDSVVETILTDLTSAFDACEAAADRAKRLTRIYRGAAGVECSGALLDALREATNNATEAADVAKQALGAAIRGRLEKEGRPA